MGRLEVVVVATVNQADAPLWWFRFADDSSQIRRDDNGPGREDVVGYTHFPHAVVMIDGTMSQFDLERRSVGRPQ